MIAVRKHAYAINIPNDSARKRLCPEAVKTNKIDKPTSNHVQSNSDPACPTHTAERE
jgi:hypothetical protein